MIRVLILLLDCGKSQKLYDIFVVKKMRIKYILLTVIFCLVSGTGYAGNNETMILRQFLYSKSLNEQQKAFNLIVANDSEYRQLVLAELQSYSAKPNEIPDALIYLAAFIKDQRYVQPLVKLINNANYSEDHCIYSCPIVFSLVVFNSFSAYVVPALDDKLTAVQDLKSEIGRVKDISIKPENASKYATGPGIDKMLHDMETLPISDIIKIAGPETADGKKRMAAAVILQSRTTNDKYLKELYWLAITNLQNDTSGEYRNAIHWAIYKTETYKKLMNEHLSHK